MLHCVDIFCGWMKNSELELVFWFLMSCPDCRVPTIAPSGCRLLLPDHHPPAISIRRTVVCLAGGGEPEGGVGQGDGDVEGGGPARRGDGSRTPEATSCASLGRPPTSSKLGTIVCLAGGGDPEFEGDEGSEGRKRKWSGTERGVG